MLTNTINEVERAVDSRLPEYLQTITRRGATAEERREAVAAVLALLTVRGGLWTLQAAYRGVSRTVREIIWPTVSDTYQKILQNKFFSSYRSLMGQGFSSGSALGDRVLTAAREGDVSFFSRISSEDPATPVAQLLEVKSKKGRTPLLVAVKHGHIDVALLLVRLGANVDASEPTSSKKYAGFTVLHFACMIDNYNLVQVLIEHGANPFIWSTNGASALDVARFYHNYRSADAIQNRLCVFKGWISCSKEGVLSKISGSKSLNYWKTYFCTILQSGCPQILEVVLFDSETTSTPPLLIRTFHVQSKVEVKPADSFHWLSSSRSSSAIQISVAEWLREEKLTNRRKTISPAILTLSPTRQDETQRWISFFQRDAGAAAARPIFIPNRNQGSGAAGGPNVSRICSQCNRPAVSGENVCRTCGASFAVPAAVASNAVNAPSPTIDGRRNSSGTGIPTAPVFQPTAPVANVEAMGEDEQLQIALAISRSLQQQREGSAILSGRATPVPLATATPSPSGTDFYSPVPVAIAEEVPTTVYATAPSAPSAPPAAMVEVLGATVPAAGARTGSEASRVVSAPGPESSSSQREQEKDECIVCFESTRTGICVPCGHNVACIECLQEIKQSNPICPYCRQEMREAIKLFRV